MSPESTSIKGVRLRLSADHLTAVLEVDPEADAGALTLERVDALASEHGLIENQERSRLIREAIESLEPERDETITFIIARGCAPQHGVDGHIEFEPGLDPNETREDQPVEQKTDDDGAVDFYSQSAFTVVRRDQLIGRLIDPTDGIDGHDVLGKPLSARTGKPFELKVEESVLLDRSNRLISQTSGIIEFSGTRLRILDELSIAGNVDFSTGNVAFPGDVAIGHGIKDCFSVRVGGSLCVRELVEAATVVVAVDCTLTRGMAARGKGSIKVGRDLSANYLDNTAVAVGRDLIVLKEISSSTTHVSRHVEAPTAALVGGTLVAGHRCEIGQVGSESGVRTTVVLGRLPELDDLALKTVEKLPEVELRFRRSRKRMETLTAQGPNLSAEQAEELAALKFSVAEEEAAVARVRAALERLWVTHRDSTKAELVVNRILFAGVRLHIGRFEAMVTRDLKGPIRIFLDKGQPKVGDPNRQEGASLKTVATVVESERYPDLEALASPSVGSKAA